MLHIENSYGRLILLDFQPTTVFRRISTRHYIYKSILALKTILNLPPTQCICRPPIFKWRVTLRASQTIVVCPEIGHTTSGGFHQINGVRIDDARFRKVSESLQSSESFGERRLGIGICVVVSGQISVISKVRLLTSSKRE